MNVKHKANIEHSFAVIEVMNRIEYRFGLEPLARITGIQDNISPTKTERVRQTTAISRREQKRQFMRMAHSVFVFN
jgi:hypothetical protein